MAYDANLWYPATHTMWRHCTSGETPRKPARGPKYHPKAKCPRPTDTTVAPKGLHKQCFILSSGTGSRALQKTQHSPYRLPERKVLSDGYEYSEAGRLTLCTLYVIYHIFDFMSP